MEVDEEAFNLDVAVDAAYNWSDKYRPRKPRFFNRVHTVRECGVMQSSSRLSFFRFVLELVPKLSFTRHCDQDVYTLKASPNASFCC